MSKETLTLVLQENVSKGLFRRFEKDLPFVDRTWEDIFALVQERVVEPRIVKTWSLTETLFGRNVIEQEALEKYPDADLVFRSWLTTSFIRSPQSSTPELAGVRTAILGSVWVVLITIIFSFPIGVGAAVYLEEYASENTINRIIQTNINNLAGVPSIIYGILGLAIFVRVMEPITSGATDGRSYQQG